MLKKLLGHKLSYVKAIIIHAFSLALQNREKSFVFGGKRLNYFSHRYNLTWLNERRVEIPIILDEIKGFKGSLLEIGNVLSHYGEIGHDVLDKYEKGNGVINKDLAEFVSDKTYDVIVSISTVEHIGQDEGLDPYRAVEAIQLIPNLLKSGGWASITFPLGYNKKLDTWIFEEDYFFKDVRFIKRINMKNEWKEISKQEARGALFDKPYPLGNVIACCRIENAK